MITDDMIKRDRELRAKQALEFPKPVEPVQVKEPKSDIALAQEETVNDTAAADTSGENYGELDTNPKQPGEIIVKIPLGGAGVAQCYYDPLTRIARPIPASTSGV